MNAPARLEGRRQDHFPRSMDTGFENISPCTINLSPVALAGTSKIIFPLTDKLGCLC